MIKSVNLVELSTRLNELVAELGTKKAEKSTVFYEYEDSEDHQMYCVAISDVYIDEDGDACLTSEIVGDNNDSRR